MMRQRRSIVYGLATVVIVLLVVVVAAILLDTSNKIQSSTSSNDDKTDDSSSSSLHATTDITNDSTSEYPWSISNSDNGEDTVDINDAHLQHEHIGPLSDFISISNITRSGSILSSPTLRNRNNRCTANNQSLMRFTLITDNYPVRTLLCAYDMIFT